MLQEYKNKTNIGVGVGIVLQVVGAYFRGQGESMEPLGLLAIIVGFLFFMWGCSSYAQGKGYSQWFGALGLFSIFGLIVLVLLPDKHK
jgi:hypothetical protein